MSDTNKAPRVADAQRRADADEPDDRVVWKFPLLPGPSVEPYVGLRDVARVKLAFGAEVLAFRCQGHVPTIWALVDPAGQESGAFWRTFVVRGTGQPLGVPKGWKLKHIGTTESPAGLVWHLWEAVGP